MKKIILSAILFLSASKFIAQTTVKSIQNKHTELVINDSISLKKGSQIQIYLPAGKDFVFVKQKKSGLSSKLLGQVADIAGTGAAAVGMGSGNISILKGTTRVITTSNAVKYGSEALDKINDLPISRDAKKIASKKMEVLDWTFTEDGWLVNALYDKKKYEIYLQEAIVSGEVKL